jgi:ferric-dicitrate binding protein FerR (iron transport regulator)
MSRIKQIIETYVNDDQPVNIRKKFAAWIADRRDGDEKNAILFRLWNDSNIEADDSTEKSYRKWLKHQIVNSRRRRKTRLFRNIARVAAVLIPLFILVATVKFYRDRNAVAEDVKFVECIVPGGEIRRVTLPDSSVAYLNAGTILIYPEKFGATRTVYINGEACLSVVHRDRQPFVVKTADLEVEVLGTVFNVYSYSSRDMSSVTLEKGKVNVRLKNDDRQKMELIPDEQFLYNRTSGTLTKRHVDASLITSWIKGDNIIRQMSLEEVARIIERRFAVTVHINSIRYENEYITIKFLKDESLCEVMKALEYLIPELKYKIENNNLYIY